MSETTTPLTTQLQATANVAADRSDALILKHFRQTVTIENKTPGKQTASEGFDPVTAADKGAEETIRVQIAADFPDHGIIGEEFATTQGTSGYDWVIDPIDGTRSFVAGLPTFGTLIGVLHDHKPTFGLMSQPFTRERYWGDITTAGYRGPDGEKQLQTRPCASLGDALLATTDPIMFNDTEIAHFNACRDAARIVRYGTDCYGYCLLAAGHIDIVVESSLNIYDIAPLIPIIQGAGGQVTNWTGGDATDGGRVVATGDARVHDDALKHLHASTS